MRWKIAQWFEIRWWQRYLSGRDKEEYLTWKRNYWRAFLVRLDLHPQPGTTILDAGCGPAGIFSVLSECKLWAVDPLIESYEAKLPHFSKQDYPHVHFEENTVEQIDKKDAFDAVFCLNVINHVKDIDAAYDALVKSLKSGGILVLSIDSHNTGFFRWLFRRVPLDILHPYQYSLEEYEAALKSRGVNIDRVAHLKSGTLFDYYAIVGTKI